MGSNINFKTFEPTPASSNRPPGIAALVRQSSVYSLTFDEFQNTVGGVGKDFGSMNMDELLKSIWTAEENQTVASSSGNIGQDGPGGGYLQRQGSLTLPRTLSQKRVEEVWRDISKEPSTPQVQAQRQQTLGEITLEEFLVKAGVVREDVPFPGKGEFFGELSLGGGSNGALATGFQQTNGRSSNLMEMRNLESVTHPLTVQSPSNLPLNINGVRSNQPSLQQPILPKQTAAAPFASQVPSVGGARGGFVGMGDQLMPNNFVQGGGGMGMGMGMGMVGLGGGPIVGVATGSPANLTSSNGISRSNGDTSSLSPVPYIFNGSMRGRKSGGGFEKVVERRQRRMIKNRESAARSRARKQAYTMELEAEIAKLKEDNEKMQKRQEHIMEMEKNQLMDCVSASKRKEHMFFKNADIKILEGGVKRLCLRRTLTGPW